MINGMLTNVLFWFFLRLGDDMRVDSNGRDENGKDGNGNKS